MTVDISKIKPGDKVTLHEFTVSYLRDDGDMRIKHAGSHFWITAEQIAAHHPAPREFQVGDRVRVWRNSPDQWVIEHIAYGRAWISRDEGQDGWLLSLDDLTLVEAGQ